MRFKHILMSLVFLMLFEQNCLANSLPQLPYAFSVKWDVSKKDNILVQDFVVNRMAPIRPMTFIFTPIAQFKTKAFLYYISIDFRGNSSSHNLTPDEVKQLRDFVGGEQYEFYTNDPVNPVRVPAKPGEEAKDYQLYLAGKYRMKSLIPGVMIPIYVKIEKFNTDKTLSIIREETINTVGEWAKGFNRPINHIVLTEGKYRITVNTLKETKVPSFVEPSLVIDADFHK